ncbi:MAG TPA: rod shape-determining protein RodA [Methylomirabilota bacterium]|nr:rod shape-determining protein RodA [Methylomirabilota bacterium]
MLRIDRRLLQNVDWPLVGTALAITAVGLLTIGSLSPFRWGSGIAFRQLIWIVGGLCLLTIVLSIDYRSLVRIAPGLYVVGFALLAWVFVLGRTVSGARRWIALGPISFQPSELAKLVTILALTWAFTWRRERSRGNLLVALTLLAPMFVLIVRQPDLGTALVLLPMTAAILLAAGIAARQFAFLALTAVGALPLAWFLLKDYQRERLLVYLDPFRDPLGSAYNVIQAKIAIGSGQLVGKGIEGATQSRLAFLPERHTDFIFAVFAEEWGFLGCLLLIAGYLFLLLRGYEIADQARDPIGRLLALGVTVLLASQVLVNLGMVTGLLPIVGIPLPFFSYGGSSMVISLMALGLLLSVRMRQFL